MFFKPCIKLKETIRFLYNYCCLFITGKACATGYSKKKSIQ